MPLIIDTYNVLHVTGILPPDLAGIETEDLAGLIRESRYRSDAVYLVCDGTPTLPNPRKSSSTHAPASARDGRGQSHHVSRRRVKVMYSGVHQSADELIERMIDRSTSPKRLIVVSSDNRILRSARRRRCRTIRSDDFLAQLEHDARRSSMSRNRKRARGGDRLLSEDEIQAWIKVFGLTERDLEL